ncbi:Uncharacterised protein [uncultured archaeon]|nr:Uncharacterised protein [uncultured archaeon]
MADFYPPNGELFAAGSIDVTPLLIHVLVLALSFVLSAYGIYGVIKYGRSASKNRHLLLTVFVLVALMPLFDLFQHFNVAPDDDFWHHAHLLMGVTAFYFIYRFAMSIDSKGPSENPRTSLVIIFGVLLLTYLFAGLETASMDSVPYVFAGAYTLILIFVIHFASLLREIMGKMGKLETAFSLKSFAVSVIPLISFMLFLLVFISVLTEYILDIFPQYAGSPVLLALIAIQNPLYIMLAMTLVGYAYIASRITAFYAPLAKFVEKKKSKGKKGHIRLR